MCLILHLLGTGTIKVERLTHTQREGLCNQSHFTHFIHSRYLLMYTPSTVLVLELMLLNNMSKIGLF